MSTAEASRTVQYVTDSEGRRTGVLLDIQAWESLVDWMEDAMDTQAAVKALTELRVTGGPRQAGWLAWDDVREEWGDEEEKGYPRTMGGPSRSG